MVARIRSSEVQGSGAATDRKMKARGRRRFSRIEPVVRNKRVLLERSSQVVTLVVRTGRPVYVTPSVERVLGYAVDEFLAFDGVERLHSEDREAVLRARRAVQGEVGRQIHCVVWTGPRETGSSNPS